MKKKLLAFVAAASMMTSVAFAAPLTDYSQGKTAIDLNWRNTEVKGESVTFDKKYNIDWGITSGLGNDWAIQYRQFNPKSDATEIAGSFHKAKLKTQEFNVLRKLDGNVSAYTGVMKTKGELDGGSSSSKNKWQLGITGSTQLADKMTAYASLGAGKDLTTWQIGVAYEVAPNVDFNLDYRQIKADKLDFDGEKVDGKAKGLGFGITYKF